MLNYDLEYFERMLRLNSKTAEEICKIRWKWIADLKPKRVLDYGSGVGWFRAYRPPGVKVFTYDIGKYPQTGIPLQQYDVLCLWDVLEHIHDFSHLEPLLKLSETIVGTIPMKPKGKSYKDWKHFKPGEHVHYWGMEELQMFFRDFPALHTDTPECPPREDVISFSFGR